MSTRKTTALCLLELEKLKTTRNRIFRIQSKLAAPRGETEVQWADTQQSRLKIFSDALQVFAEGSTSIDQRLWKNHSQKAILSSLLTTVLSNIRSLTAHSSRQDEAVPTLVADFPLKAGKSGSGTKPTVQEDANNTNRNETTQSDNYDHQPSVIRQRINSDIGILLNFASLVRSQNNLRYDVRGVNYTPLSRTGKDLLVRFESAAAKLLSKELSHFGRWCPPQPHYLERRLLRTLLQRWRVLCYHNKGTEDISRDELVPKRDVRATNRGSGTGLKKRVPYRPRLITPHIDDSPSAKSFNEVSENTSISKPSFGEGSLRGSQDLFAPTSNFGKYILSIPQPDKSLFSPEMNGRVEYTCPLCSLPQTVSAKRFQHEWEQHLIQDLSPYVCVFEECGEPFKTYGSAEQWHRHLKDKHATKKWICNDCDDELEFLDAIEFRDHLIGHHHFRIPDAEMNFLLEKTATTNLTFSRCPICNGHGNKESSLSMGITREVDQNQQEKIRDCIKNHLMKIALISLPRDALLVENGHMSTVQAERETTWRELQDYEAVVLHSIPLRLLNSNNRKYPRHRHDVWLDELSCVGFAQPPLKRNRFEEFPSMSAHDFERRAAGSEYRSLDKQSTDILSDLDQSNIEFLRRLKRDRFGGLPHDPFHPKS